MAPIAVATHPASAQEPPADKPAETAEPAQNSIDQFLAPMRAAFAAGNVDEAVRIADLLLRRSGELGQSDELPRFLANFMTEQLSERGRYREAERYLRWLVADAERRLGPDDQDTQYYLDQLANMLREMGRYAEAEPMFVRLVEAAERNPGPTSSEMQASLVNLGNLYRFQDRAGEAEAVYLRALTIEGTDWQTRFAAVVNLAALLVNQRRYAEAEPLYLRELQAIQSAQGPDFPDALAVTVNLGQLYTLQQRHADAEAQFRRGLEGFMRSVGPDHPNTLTAMSNLASSISSQGRYAEAEPVANQALAARERVLGTDNPQTVTAAMIVADIYAAQGKTREAEPLYARAMQARTSAFGSDHPQAISAAVDLAEARLLLEGTDAVSPARQAVQGLRARLSRVASDLTGEGQSDRLRSQNRSRFTILPDAAWAASASRRELTGDAFLALQDAVNSTAGQAVARMAVRQLAERERPELNLGNLVRERDDLITQWTANGDQLARAVTTRDAAAATTRLRADRSRIETRLREIDAALRRDLPQFFTLVRPEAISLQQAQALLAPDEAILLVVPGARGTHVVAVSATDVGWVRSDWNERQVDESVRRLLWDVGASVQVDSGQAAEWERRGGAGYPFDRGTAHALYRQLVAPVANVLAGKRHVFTSAGGSLTSLPLGILVTEPPQGADGDPAALRATRWFADAHALMQIPSLQSLMFLRRFARERSGPRGTPSFLGFGDPALQGQAVTRGRLRGRAAAASDGIFAAQLDRNGTAAINLGQLRLMSRLPGTAVELRNMREALGAPADSLFLAERATEANVKAADLRSASILAFATHGLLAGNLSETREPGLVFTPPAQLTERDNGYLSSSEVAALQLDADWVILSACDTAAGDGSEGAPGLSGLARAFFYAGARNLLASHWPLRDDVASVLTVRTIRLQSERPDLSRAEALQLAMREIRNDPSHDSATDTWAHPNAWAPFSLIGDGAR